MNVREKASLAYYASSAFDSFTGLLRVNAGIDAGNYQQARELILEQLQAMQSGDFTAQEIEQTKTMLKILTSCRLTLLRISSNKLLFTKFCLNFMLMKQLFESIRSCEQRRYYALGAKFKTTGSIFHERRSLCRRRAMKNG